ncbi:MAG: hypothetical protein KDJ36_13970, partial [Hyphomicrobiaceae bacterium]|nr:hypothetical protein [Hyphomicrobiaceae bacterium]
LDELPDDAGHLVAVQLDHRSGDFDLRHGRVPFRLAAVRAARANSGTLWHTLHCNKSEIGCMLRRRPGSAEETGYGKARIFTDDDFSQMMTPHR